jgi:hypothetical protein
VVEQGIGIRTDDILHEVRVNPKPGACVNPGVEPSCVFTPAAAWQGWLYAYHKKKLRKTYVTVAPGTPGTLTYFVGVGVNEAEVMQTAPCIPLRNCSVQLVRSSRDACRCVP